MHHKKFIWIFVLLVGSFFQAAKPAASSDYTKKTLQTQWAHDGLQSFELKNGAKMALADKSIWFHVAGHLDIIFQGRDKVEVGEVECLENVFNSLRRYLHRWWDKNLLPEFGKITLPQNQEIVSGSLPSGVDFLSKINIESVEIQMKKSFLMQWSETICARVARCKLEKAAQEKAEKLAQQEAKRVADLKAREEKFKATLLRYGNDCKGLAGSLTKDFLKYGESELKSVEKMIQVEYCTPTCNQEEAARKQIYDECDQELCFKQYLFRLFTAFKADKKKLLDDSIELCEQQQFMKNQNYLFQEEQQARMRLDYEAKSFMTKYIDIAAACIRKGQLFEICKKEKSNIESQLAASLPPVAQAVAPAPVVSFGRNGSALSRGLVSRVPPVRQVNVLVADPGPVVRSHNPYGFQAISGSPDDSGSEDDESSSEPLTPVAGPDRVVALRRHNPYSITAGFQVLPLPYEQ